MTPREWLWRLIDRSWLRRHGRHAWRDLTGPVWFCSCGAHRRSAWSRRWSA